MDVSSTPPRPGRAKPDVPWVHIEFNATDAGLVADILYGGGVVPEDVLLSILMGAASLTPAARVEVEVGVRHVEDAGDPYGVRWLGTDPGALARWTGDRYEHVQRLRFTGAPEPVGDQAGKMVQGVPVPASVQPIIMVDGYATDNAELSVQIGSGMADWSVRGVVLAAHFGDQIGCQVPVSIHVPGLALHGEAITVEVVEAINQQSAVVTLKGMGGLRPQMTG